MLYFLVEMSTVCNLLANIRIRGELLQIKHWNIRWGLNSIVYSQKEDQPLVLLMGALSVYVICYSSLSHICQ